MIWLALLAGIVGGVAIFAVAGWSRTRSALPAFERFAPPADAAVADTAPAPGDVAVLQQIAQAAGVNSSLMIASVAISLPQPDGTVTALGAVASPVPTTGPVDRPYVVAGRLPDPSRADELVVNESAAAHLHLHPGSAVDVGLFGASQAGNSGEGPPPAPLVDVPMTVTGVVRYTADLERSPDAQPGTEFETASDRVSLSDGFWPVYGSRVAVDFMGMAVRLPDGPAGFTRLTDATAQLSNGRFTANLGDNFIPNRPALVRAIDLQAAALLAAGLAAAIAVAVLIAQALVRAVTSRSSEHQILVGLGMTRRQVTGAEVLAMTPVAIAAAVVALIVGAVLSPLAPVGIARSAELHHRVNVNWGVAAMGVVAVVTVTLGAVALGAWSSGRRRRDLDRSKPALASRAGEVGAPPTMVVGLDVALSRSGGATAPLRPALAGLVVGVIIAVGAWVVHSSLNDLLATSAQRGWAWDAQVGDITSPDSAAAATAALSADPDVAGFAGETSGIFVPIDGRPTPLLVFDEHAGVASPIVLEGHAPEAANEIALGPDTLAALHKHVGDEVSVVGPDGTALDLRVVGQIVPPAAVDSLESFGNGAVIPIATAEQATGGGPPPTPDAFLVSFRPGVDRTAALARLNQLFPRTVLVAPSSVDVDTLRHVDWLPVVLAGLVGLVTAGTLVHVVVSNARRRRREFGVLRALGFTGSQVVASVTCMATVLVLGMLLIGLPLGIVAGRATWTVIADDLGTAALPDVPAPLLLLLVPVGLVVGVVASAWPAWRIIRQPPARAIRAE